MANLKTGEDIDGIKKAGKILVDILKTLRKDAKEGVRLSDLDREASKMLKEAGAESAFFNYKPEGADRSFPGHICASLNENVVHGIPGRRTLKEGDLLKIDFGVIYKRYIADAAITVPIGKIPDNYKKLIEATKKSLNEAIKQCRVGLRLGDLGYAVEKTITESGFKVIKTLTGHGVGFSLHEDPTVFNFGEKGRGLVLEEGMVLAIEPMAAIGAEDVRKMPDESYTTIDGSMSAHFEKTVAVTDDGPEILTSID